MFRFAKESSSEIHTLCQGLDFVAIAETLPLSGVTQSFQVCSGGDYCPVGIAGGDGGQSSGESLQIVKFSDFNSPTSDRLSLLHFKLGTTVTRTATRNVPGPRGETTR